MSLTAEHAVRSPGNRPGPIFQALRETADTLSFQRRALLPREDDPHISFPLTLLGRADEVIEYRIWVPSRP